MRRVSNLTRNTIGKRRCEQILNRILIEENCAYLTNRVISRYNRFRDGCIQLFRIKESCWRNNFTTMWYHKTIEGLDKDKDLFTESSYTFLRNCIVAHFRTIIRGHEK